MNLDLALGLSCSNQSSITTDKVKGLIAYPASGVLVIFKPQLNSQIAYLRVLKNAISCASFSPDGHYIVTGEKGYRPALRVWSVQDGTELATMTGHEFGIKAVLFSPSGNFIISVGQENDNEVNVWAWPSRHRKATNKIKDCIHAVSFSECGRFFVTVGVRHIKFWYPKQTLATEDPSFKIPLVVPLYGRPATLGEFKDNIFLDVCCGSGVCSKFVYVISKAGNLIIMNSSSRNVCSQKSLTKDKLTCVYVMRQIIFLGAASGLIHLLSALSLQHLATLPIPAFFNNKLALDRAVFTMVFNPTTRILTAIYMNTSMCTWDLAEGQNIKQTYRAVYPKACITDMHVVPSGINTRGYKDTLVTVSHDFNVHLWSITTSDTILFEKLNILATEEETPIEGNVDLLYQQPLKNKIAIEEWSQNWTQNNNPFDDLEDTANDSSVMETDNFNLTSPLNSQDLTEDAPEEEEAYSELTYVNLDEQDPLVSYVKEPNNITTVLICKGKPKCHPEFNHIVTGNTIGNITAHDAVTFEHHVTLMSHNRDVTSLAFYADSHGRMTLLSGGRDRLIHIMDAQNNYCLVRTLDIHSSSINALRIVEYLDQVYLISCAADRSLKICTAQNTSEDGRKDVSLFQLSKASVGVSSPNDVTVFKGRGELASAYQDGYIRVFDLLSLQGRRVFKGCKGNECQVTKIAICSHGVLLITAASDRTINVINFTTGSIIVSMAGHYKMVTGLDFSSSGEYVISAAMDGCIFFWRISQRLKDFQLEHSKIQGQHSPGGGQKGAHNKSFNGFVLLDKHLNVEKISMGPEKNYDIITLEKTREPTSLNRLKRMRSNNNSKCQSSPTPSIGLMSSYQSN